MERLWRSPSPPDSPTVVPESSPHEAKMDQAGRQGGEPAPPPAPPARPAPIPNTEQAYVDCLARLAASGTPVFFLEIGAADGKSFDLLFPLASRGNWRGVLVKPIPDLFERLKSSYAGCPGVRFENVAISDRLERRVMKRVPLDVIADGKVPDWSLGISSFYSDRNAIGSKRIDARCGRSSRPTSTP
jgi:hypothetical protein